MLQDNLYKKFEKTTIVIKVKKHVQVRNVIKLIQGQKAFTIIIWRKTKGPFISKVCVHFIFINKEIRDFLYEQLFWEMHLRVEHF